MTMYFKLGLGMVIYKRTRVALLVLGAMLFGLAVALVQLALTGGLALQEKGTACQAEIETDLMVGLSEPAHLTTSLVSSAIEAKQGGGTVRVGASTPNGDLSAESSPEQIACNPAGNGWELTAKGNARMTLGELQFTGRLELTLTDPAVPDSPGQIKFTLTDPESQTIILASGDLGNGEAVEANVSVAQSSLTNDGNGINE